MRTFRLIGLIIIFLLIAGFVVFQAQAIVQASGTASILGFTDTPEKNPTKEPPSPPVTEPPSPPVTEAPGSGSSILIDPHRDPKSPLPATALPPGQGAPSFPTSVMPTSVLPTRAFTSNSNSCNATVHYMVNFVCGLQGGLNSPALEPPVKPGNYATAIDIHNYTDESICGTQRPALPYTLFDSALPPAYPERGFELAPASVLELDCNTIWVLTGVESGTFMKGMIDLGFDRELPVVAIYTAEITDEMAFTGSGAGISIDVEYLTPFTH